MIDFVEYVVAELSNKRLTKSEAISLIRQFQQRSKSDSGTFHIHPLLHTNLSDLYQLSYSSRLDGDEFYLRDHVVHGQKVLPGVAYLEMARAAVAAALAPEPGTGVELRNVVWAQPIMVAASTDVSISLLPGAAGQIDFEVTSLAVEADGSASETVHSRGLALIGAAAAPRRHDLAQLAAQMTRGKIDGATLYEVYAALGIAYGPAHRAVCAIDQGEHQLLAHLELPEQASAGYLLHPSIMDGAVQAALGFAADIGNLSEQLRLPFALDALRIHAPCTGSMVAWLRYAAGSAASDSVVKLDIDLCDSDGNVCVEMRGFSARAVKPQDTVKALYATSVWEDRLAAPANGARDQQRHIVLSGFAGIDTGALIPGSQCLQLPEQKGIAERYSDAALRCFELIKSILAGKPQQPVLLQLAIAGDAEQALLTGLSGLFKSASLENPALTTQIVLADPRTGAEQLAQLLQQAALAPQDAVIRHTGDGKRQVLALRELDPARHATIHAYKEHGVYLITGGLGGLGMLFAQDVLARSPSATVVLTGRAALSAEHRTRLDALGKRVHYRQLDLGDAKQVRRAVTAIVKEHGRLDGILHAAGMLADSFILKKDAAQFRDVLGPKVAGTVNLDDATKDIDLDFMVLFSAGAALTGNVGQADYACANGFLDQFAAYRHQLKRKGKTRAINWPLWQDGGMGSDAATRQQLKQQFGMHPLRTETGLQALHLSLALPDAQLHVVEGDLVRLRKALFAPAVTQPVPVAAPKLETGNAQQRTQEFLKKHLSQVLKLAVNKIDAAAPFEKYGIDSIMMMDLTNALEKVFGSLPKTLFFEYQSLAELARYFIKAHADRLATLAAPAVPEAPAPVPVPAAKIKTAQPARRLRQLPAATPAGAGPIAIVGLSGRYPNSPDIEAYWDNLRDGKDCVVEVPASRWDWKAYYTEDRSKPGRHYSKWGGFIEGVDEFDPLFFNISPREASMVDPQERLFLQHAWMAVEDAGYTRASLQVPRNDGLSGMVGVYVGVMYGEYNLSGSLASIANRVSYVLNVHGPSMTLDSMCSSSLTAIHLACQDLKQGRTDIGIAGGVNLSIHPSKYLLLSAGQFISSDGHCQSFGEGGDGYIPGEGVGAVVLKRLADAERDGDHIYGIIKGSALNHGGKTNGYTVPNPHAQAAVITQALAEAGTDPRHVSYVEAHGTGTKLGDPIEILALSNAFYQDGSHKEAGFCAIGSAKSNIGHCESAAGIAGLTKILLQMQHRQIVPSLHSTRLNPNIDFGSTPFIVNQTLRSWDRPLVAGRELPRIAGMSSFGAGGSNAHIVVEEFVPSAATPARAADAEFIVPLSARTVEQLKRKAADLLAFLRTYNGNLASLAYTLQVGREAMEERLGFVATSLAQLASQLGAYADGASAIDGAAQGSAKRNNDTLSLFSDDADLQETVAKWMARRNLGKLLALWTKGVDLAWNELHDAPLPKRCSLPAYPFARDKYWIETVGQVVKDAVAGAAAVPVIRLHPLLHTNTSSLGQQSYSARFDGDEWFLRSSPGVLPAALCLEMARAAVENASHERPESGFLELRRLAWGQPFATGAGQDIRIAMAASASGQIDFDIYSADLVHCQGQAGFSAQQFAPSIDLGAVKRRTSADERLVQLSLPSDRDAEQGAWLLHPAAMDAVLEAARAITGSACEPLSLDYVGVVFGCVREMLIWVRRGQDNVIDADLCDLQGTVCVQLRGLALQQLAAAPRALTLAEPAPFTPAPLQRKSIRLLAADQVDTQVAPVKAVAVRLSVPQETAIAALLAQPVAVAGNLVQQLTATLAEALYMEAAQIDATKPFVELGLDSIVGVEWVKVINKQFGVNLSATKVYDYPTIEALATLVSGEIGVSPVVAVAAAAPVEPVAAPQGDLLAGLKTSLAESLYMDIADIDASKPFVELGLDSIVGVEWVKAINKQYGIELSATRVYDYPTIEALASLVADEIGKRPGAARPAAVVPSPVQVAVRPAVRLAAPAPAAAYPVLQRKVGNGRTVATPVEKIAIIGMSGRYPQASNLRQFWDNLAAGKNAIVEIPPSRWDVNQYFDPHPGAKGKIYCKWLGMLDDADCFDPLFFQISPAEAESMDPQHRLFMQEAYKAFEDAGYSNKTLSNKQCGVYLGIMNNEYSLLLSRAGSNTVDATGTSFAIGAARIAYYLNLKGPAIPIDTACSSSLVGIHLACQALLNGEIDMALAGGSTLYLTPDSYLGMCQAGMLSPEGQCKTFDNRANGFVPGEGAGAVVLKRLSDAEADNDHIYGVILGSAINQDGKTNGITAPSVNSQIALERQLYARCNIDPATITYVETHGTGTKLGDPIELEALGTVFSEKTAKKNFCALGSVKSNIGHTSAAAGVASVQKVLLSMRHRTLVPSLNVNTENGLFDFANSPFYISRERQQWTPAPDTLRRAAVSSFGFSGTNAHLVLEEYAAPVRKAAARAAQYAVVLSARTTGQLEQKARELVDFLQTESADLASLAYTLQTGREAFRERLACVSATVDELAGQLQAFVAGAREIAGLWCGQAARDKVQAPVAGKPLADLAALWVNGADLDWPALYAGQSTPQRMSLPTYPFAMERYWVAAPAPAAPVVVVEAKERTYYTSVWKASPLAAGRAMMADVPTLVFDSSGEVFGVHPSAITVTPGAAFGEVGPNAYTLDVSCEAQFQQLADALQARAMLPHHVIHRCTGDGVMELFSLCKALMAHQPSHRTRIVSVFASTAEAQAPQYAAIGAFFKALTLENPNFVGKIIDVRTTKDPVALVQAEFADPHWQSVDVRYRQDERQVRELGRGAAGATRELPLKQGGVYLITGGLGGLGLIVAEYLVNTFKAQVALIGRSTPSAAQQARLDRLGGAVYVQGDVAILADMQRVVADTRARFGPVNGVFHSAGVNRDAFIIKKSRDEMQTVLAAKVDGTINLDLACAAEALDVFVLFSSIAGTLGNVGQCDYAYANAFLDAYAENRQQLRPGKSLSIAWPLWADGGMTISSADVARNEASLGVSPLPTSDGIAYLEHFLRSDLSTAVALYGNKARIDSHLAAAPRREMVPAPAQEAGSVDEIQVYLKRLIGQEIRLAPDLIDIQERFDAFGIDSIIVGRLNASLAQDLGELPKTLFYEYQSIEELAGYLAKSAARPFVPVASVPQAPPVAPQPAERKHSAEPIAIIGMHGLFPQSENLQQYWENLKTGKDMVGLVPSERWDFGAYYDADPQQAAAGKIYCKSGGFLDDALTFDSGFFNIAAEEAAIIDPQERIFLQSVWSAFEDAGYTRHSLRQRHPKAKSADVGVFVGVTTNSHQMLQSEEWARGNITAPSSLPWSIANRVSYYFDLQGPSMPIDTACSSSLVAVHMACESLNRNECQVAVAGGVNLYLHPSKFHSFCQRGMLAEDGMCRSYGAGGDGFVPAEAVATLILKPLSRAIADGDPIHAVIAGSAVEHGGRSNGYSAPNPQSQASVISAALDKAGFGVESIGYVEGHGTGTQLGDNLEITALTQAFRTQTSKRQFCPVGSVKANLGHAESAAGIVGIAKIVLQMQHRQLAPSLHSDEVNPNIDFGNTPFYLQHKLAPWEPANGQPRRSLVNSFGAGGVNACVALEEYVAPAVPAAPAAPQMVILSAKTADGLARRVEQLLAMLDSESGITLANLAYTLQVGREAMPERLALVAGSLDELGARLREDDGVCRGCADPRKAKKASKSREAFNTMYAAHDLAGLAEHWVAGTDIDWERLHAANPPARISLPTYPFAKDRHWVPDQAATAGTTRVRSAPAGLHPLISYNSSTLSEVTFSSWLSADEFYAQDHRVNGVPMFPGSGYLEIACVAGALAGGRKVSRLTDIVWVAPLVFSQSPQLVQIALQTAQDSVEYMVTSFGDGDDKQVHSEGIIYFAEEAAVEQQLSLEDLQDQCTKQLDPAHYYALFEQSGISYGPAFRTMQTLAVGPAHALSSLKIADHLRTGFDEFVLHPSIIDGALQTVAALVGQGESATPFLPFAIDEVQIVRALAPACHVLVEHADGTPHGGADIMRFNIRILNGAGHVLVNIRNFCVRALASNPANVGDAERKAVK